MDDGPFGTESAALRLPPTYSTQQSVQAILSQHWRKYHSSAVREFFRLNGYYEGPNVRYIQWQWEMTTAGGKGWRLGPTRRRSTPR